VGYKTLLQQNPPFPNWRCQLMHVDMHNGCKMVVFCCQIASLFLCCVVASVGAISSGSIWVVSLILSAAYWSIISCVSVCQPTYDSNRKMEMLTDDCRNHDKYRNSNSSRDANLSDFGWVFKILQLLYIFLLFHPLSVLVPQFVCS